METTSLGHATSTPGLPGSSNPVHKASSTAHAAVNSVAGAADEAARNIKPAIARVSSLAHQAVDNVASKAAPAADWLSEQGKNSCSYVSANPLKSIGVALAAGFLLSRIILR